MADLLNSSFAREPDERTVLEMERDASREDAARARAEQERLSERARTLAERLLAAETANARLLPAEEEVRRLTAENARVRDESAAHAARIAALDAESASLRAHIAEQGAAIAVLENTVKALKSSTSWKITRPLRAIVTSLRGR